MTTSPAPDPTSGRAVAPRPASPLRAEWLMLALVLLAGALVRLGGLFNDLWFDEIWSLNLVSVIHSPGQVFTEILHDNNHPLNSLFLYFVMPAKADWIYRLPSWIAGTAAVGVAGLIGRRQFRLVHPTASAAQISAAGVLTATLIGASYLLVHYSSEARGYAPAVAFSVLAIHALWHDNGRTSGWWAALYGVACVLGLLSHVAAIQIVIAGLVWSLLHAISGPGSARSRVLHLAAWQLAPCAFLGIYHFAFISKLTIGGGPEHALLDVLGETAAFTLGLPVGTGRFVALPLLLVATIGSLWIIGRARGRHVAIFYANVIFIAPTLGLVSSRFANLYPRYFILSAACALLLTGNLLAWLWSGGRAARTACLALVILFLAGNAVHITRLMRFGRGHYQEALRHVVAHSPNGVITISSDHDFRNFAVIAYYAVVGGPEHPLQYYPSDQLPPEGTQWLLVHHLEGEPPLAAEQFDVRRNRFRLDGIYRYSALSGWDWYVYRNVRLLPETSPSGTRKP